MSNHETSDTNPSAKPASEKEVRSLLRAAGRRPEPPAEDLAAINAAARSAWEDLVHEQRSRERSRFAAPRGRRVYALAAALLLAVLAGWLWLRAERSPIGTETVATVEVVRGDAARGEASLSPGAPLRTGEVIATGPDGRLAARMVDGQSVRLDHDTVLRMTSRRSAELVRGAVYVDSPPGEEADRRIDIQTPLGTVVEIGTQYEVRLDEPRGVLEVRVREGAVSVRRDGKSVTARPGEELTVRRDGSVSRATLATDAEAWAWTFDAAPRRDIEGERLADFLSWLGREAGWEIVYESEELAAAASDIRLHGSVEGLHPSEILDVVLLGSGLAYELEGGRLSVSRPRQSAGSPGSEPRAAA